MTPRRRYGSSRRGRTRTASLRRTRPRHPRCRARPSPLEYRAVGVAGYIAIGHGVIGRGVIGRGVIRGGVIRHVPSRPAGGRRGVPRLLRAVPRGAVAHRDGGGLLLLVPVHAVYPVAPPRVPRPFWPTRSFGLLAHLTIGVGHGRVKTGRPVANRGTVAVALRIPTHRRDLERERSVTTVSRRPSSPPSSPPCCSPSHCCCTCPGCRWARSDVDVLRAGRPDRGRALHLAGIGRLRPDAAPGADRRSGTAVGQPTAVPVRRGVGGRRRLVPHHQLRRQHVVPHRCGRRPRGARAPRPPAPTPRASPSRRRPGAPWSAPGLTRRASGESSNPTTDSSRGHPHAGPPRRPGGRPRRARRRSRAPPWAGPARRAAHAPRRTPPLRPAARRAARTGAMPAGSSASRQPRSRSRGTYQSPGFARPPGRPRAARSAGARARRRCAAAARAPARSSTLTLGKPSSRRLVDEHQRQAAAAQPLDAARRPGCRSRRSRRPSRRPGRARRPACRGSAAGSAPGRRGPAPRRRPRGTGP